MALYIATKFSLNNSINVNTIPLVYYEQNREIRAYPEPINHISLQFTDNENWYYTLYLFIAPVNSQRFDVVETIRQYLENNNNVNLGNIGLIHSFNVIHNDYIGDGNGYRFQANNQSIFRADFNNDGDYYRVLSTPIFRIPFDLIPNGYIQFVDNNRYNQQHQEPELEPAPVPENRRIMR